MVKTKVFNTIFGLSFIAAAAAANADHNSIWGEGLANMPNDIHNTRIETMDDETDDFMDFVRMGSGSDSINDADDIDAGSGSSTSMGGGSQSGSRGGRS